MLMAEPSLPCLLRWMRSCTSRSPVGWKPISLPLMYTLDLVSFVIAPTLLKLHSHVPQHLFDRGLVRVGRNFRHEREVLDQSALGAIGGFNAAEPAPVGAVHVPGFIQIAVLVERRLDLSP